MRAWVEGVGLAGPGLRGWLASLPLLAGQGEYAPAPTELTASALLPAAERRRIGVPIKLALAVGSEAFANASRSPAATATVFASSGGDGENVHQICTALSTPEREVSPTRFHNSVHNAAAGYWGIAVGSREPSTSVCAYDNSFAAGLLEAAVQIAADGMPVALIAYDHRYPSPLNAARPISFDFGVALVLAPEPTTRTIASLDIVFVATPAAATLMTDPDLESVRATIPAARSLPLLAALCRKTEQVVILDSGPRSHLRVAVASC